MTATRLQNYVENVNPNCSAFFRHPQQNARPEETEWFQARSFDIKNLKRHEQNQRGSQAVKVLHLSQQQSDGHNHVVECCCSELTHHVNLRSETGQKFQSSSLIPSWHCVHQPMQVWPPAGQPAKDLHWPPSVLSLCKNNQQMVRNVRALRSEKCVYLYEYSFAVSMEKEGKK